MSEIITAEKLFSDPLWRLNNLYHIVDKQGKKVKFKLNWAQEHLYKNMHYCNLILKARQLGISTFTCLLFLDRCLFNSNVAAGVISHTNDDAVAMFKRIKFAYDNLPEEIKSLRAANTDSAKELVFSNGSSIRVGTSMRGSTFQYLHISEFGKICAKYPEKAKEIITGSLNTIATGQYIFVESTAEGRSGHFYEMCNTAKEMHGEKRRLSPLDFKFFFYPWWQHPDYRLEDLGVRVSVDMQEYFDSLRTDHHIDLLPEQKAWYAAKARTQSDSMMQEYPCTPEEAFFTSNEGLYYGRHMARARVEGRIRKVYHDPNLATYVSFDLGYSDFTSLWFWQMVNQEIRLIDFYEKNGEPLTHYLKIVKDKPYSISKVFAPHDANVTEYSSGISRADVAKKHGVKFTVLPKLEIIDGINAVRNLLDRCFFDEEKCADGIKALESYSKKWNNSFGCWSDTQANHNWASHASDSFRYLAQAIEISSDSGMSIEEYRRKKAEIGLYGHKQSNSILGN